MVQFNWFTWPPGIFLTLLAFYILYGFSILYRVHAKNFIDSQNIWFTDNLQDAQSRYENSLAYWPQGLFAIACAVTDNQ